MMLRIIKEEEDREEDISSDQAYWFRFDVYVLSVEARENYEGIMIMRQGNVLVMKANEKILHLTIAL